jgi:PKD repeat protein
MTALFLAAFGVSALFLKTFADSAFAAGPAAHAGSDITVFVGEAVRLDGSASTGYMRESQADGTWSIRWQTGDGFDAENIIKIPHVYTAPGVYTATLTVKDASGAASTSTVRVTAVDIPTASASNAVLLTNTGNPDTNRNNLQAAVNQAAASPNTREVLVPAGFVFNDPLILPARTSTNYVTIRVADLSALPANTRVTGSATDRAKLFRMNMRGNQTSGYSNAVQMNLGAHYYRIIGLEIRHMANELNTDMIGNRIYSDWRSDNSHFIFDRCLLDGNGFETRKAAVLNGKTMSLINSSVLDIKAVGVETKAVAQWDGAGPLAVVNNRLEAASINSLIGGASDPSPSGILDGYVFRGNYVWKNPAWQTGGYTVKNSWELKQGFNSVAVGNIFENNYEDGQAGEAIVLKSMTDDGCASCEVRNVDFRNNKILNTRAGFNVINMQAFNAPHPLYANHIRFANNFWEERDGRGICRKAPTTLNSPTILSCQPALKVRGCITPTAARACRKATRRRVINY